MLSATFAALRSIDGLTLRVGWTDPEVARIVAINEDGSLDGRRPPARPVLVPVLDEHVEEILGEVDRIVAGAVTSADPAGAVERGLDSLGGRVEDLIRDRIDRMEPGNAASTIARKGADAPLRGGPRAGARDRIWDGVTHDVRRT